MAKKDTFFFVVNPSAGGGQVRSMWPIIERRLREHAIPFESRQTGGAREAIDLTREALREGYRRFVAVGGDGTNHEIINGLFAETGSVSDDVSLGFFPAGSGNDFLRFLRVPADLDDGFRRLTEPNKRKVDIGKMSFQCDGNKAEEYFISVAGTGFTADVTKTANDHFKFMGQLCYVGAFFPNILSFSNVELEIVIDGKAFTRNSCMIVVANTAFFGGGMNIAPGASVEDGLFEVLLFREFSRLELIANFPKVFKGQHIHHPKVEVFRGKDVMIRSAAPQNLLADGEIIGLTPVEFHCLPQSMTVHT